MAKTSCKRLFFCQVLVACSSFITDFHFIFFHFILLVLSTLPANVDKRCEKEEEQYNKTTSTKRNVKKVYLLDTGRFIYYYATFDANCK